MANRRIRKYDRKFLELSCLLYINDYQISCETRNISKDGICFVLPPEIYVPLGSHVMYQLLKRGSSHTREATVVRIAQDRTCTIIGCETSLKEEDMLKLL